MNDFGARPGTGAEFDRLGRRLADVADMPLGELIRSDDGALLDAMRQAVADAAAPRQSWAAFDSAVPATESTPDAPVFDNAVDGLLGGAPDAA